MAQSKLNVLLGLDISAFSRSIAMAANKMEQFGKRMESIGSDLTTRLTLPLVGVGAAAVTAFADLEKLEKGMVAIMGSTEAASSEFIRLREVAKLPGLGLKEAVQGSINLQAVGLSADEASATLLGFGKALAATGNGRVDLEAIQYQLTQMISKNKLLAEDYKVIQSRLPLMAQGMQAAFGTSNVENIRAAGVGAKEFVMRLVQGLNSLPQTQNVMGGLANAFENFGDTVFIAGAALGKSINEALGLEGILNKLSGALEGLINIFTSLSPTTQKIIVIIATLTAAIGPLLFVIGAVTKVIPLLVAGFTAIKGALVALAGPIALKIAAFTALVYIIKFLYDRFELVRRGINGLAQGLIFIAKTLKNTVVNIVNALKKLKDGDFAGAGKAFSESATVGLKDIGKAFADGFADTTNYVDKGIENLKARIQGAVKDFTPKITPEIVEPTGGGGGGGGAAVSGLSIPRIDSTQQSKVFAQIEKDAFEKFGNARKAVEGFNSTLAAIPDVKTPMDGIKNALKDMQKQLQDTDITMKIFGGTTDDILKSKLSLLENGIAEGIRLYGEESLLVQGLIEQYKKLKGEIEEITLAQENRKKLEEAVGGAIRQAGDLIAQSISQQGASLKKLGQAALESAKLIIKSLIQEGVAGYIRNILAGPTGKALGPIALGVAAAGGTIAAGIFSAAVGKIGVPRLAQGGLATKETLAVVGDNPSGKEAIIPFERMGEFLDMAGGGAMRLVGQFEVRGQDLVLVLDRATQQKLRVR